MSERPSPYSIAVCVLIALYSDPNSPLQDILESTTTSTSTTADNTTTTTTTINHELISTFIESSVMGGASSASGGSDITSTTNAATTTTSQLSRWLHRLCQVGSRDNGTTTRGTTGTTTNTSSVGVQTATLILETLQLAVESVDSLMDLMESIQRAFQPWNDDLVDADSVNGLYLRQVHLGFEELSFESVTLLWKHFHSDVSNTTVKNNDDDGTTQQPPPPPQQVWDWPPSTHQLHEMIRKDCMDFQQQNEVMVEEEEEESSTATISNSTTSTKTTTTQQQQKRRQRQRHRCSFEDMELYIRSMLEKEPELPVAYFLRYLNCLRHGERVGALDALHQYFDHAMVQHSPTLLSSNSSSRRNNASSSSGSSISSDILQFSAIVLAMTHSKFGDADLALMATEEAVRVAQQSKDTACVAFALGWLYEHHGHGTVERRALLERCAVRASAAGISTAAATATSSTAGTPGGGGQQQHHLQHHQQMTQAAQANAIRAQQLRPLVSGAHLTLAQHDLLEGDSSPHNTTNSGSGNGGGMMEHDVGGGNGASSTTINRRRMTSYARAWSNVLQVTAEPSADPNVYDRPTHLTPNPNDTKASMARQQLVSAAIWDAVGQPTISSWTTKSVLMSLPDDMTYDDMITCIQNVSKLALYGTPTTTLSSTGTVSPSSTAPPPPLSSSALSSNISVRTNMTKNPSKQQSPPNCIYATAVETLILLRKQLGMDGNDLEEPILHNLVLTLHEWAVNRMEFDDATALQKALNSYLHPGLSNYDQFCIDINMQQCLYYTRIQDWDRAKLTTKQGLEICEKVGFVRQRVRFLLQRSMILLESNRMHCTSALSPLLDALAICEGRDMHSLHALGISILAHIFLRLSNPKRAISLLNASIPTLLEREHVWFQAEAYRTLAMAHMNVAVRITDAQESNKKLNTQDGDDDTGTATTTNINTAAAMSIDANDENTNNQNDVNPPPPPAAALAQYRKALSALQTCETLYESCQDRHRLQESIYLQTQIFNVLKDTDRRDVTAERFLSIYEGNSSNGRDDKSSSLSSMTILDALDDPDQLLALAKRGL